MIETRGEFDFENALKALRQGQAFLGKEGILKPLIKRLSEEALECEFSSHLAAERSVNRRKMG